MRITRLCSIAFIAVLAVPLRLGSQSASQGGEHQRVNDKDATVISFEDMPYPLLACVSSLQGVVVVRASLDQDGKVLSAKAISGPDLLAKDALANIRKWHFDPNGNKTAIVVYEFRLIEGECGGTRGQLFVFRQPNQALVVGCDCAKHHWVPSSK